MNKAYTTVAVEESPAALVAAAGDHSILPGATKRPVFFAQNDSCDLVIMRNGDEVRVKVREIDPEFVRYRRCDNLQGPVYTTRKSDIFMVKYANGTKEVMQETGARAAAHSPVPEKPANRIPWSAKKTLPAGVLALALSVLPLFLPSSLLILVLLMEAAAFILGISAVVKISSNPDYFRGKGYAITAIVISAIFLGIMLLAFLLL